MILPSKNTCGECVSIAQWSECWPGKSVFGRWVRFPLETVFFDGFVIRQKERKEKSLSLSLSLSNIILHKIIFREVYVAVSKLFLKNKQNY